MKQVTGIYRKVAWIFLLLGSWILIGYGIRLFQPHPHNTTRQLILNMLLLGGTPFVLAFWMFRNLKREKNKSDRSKSS